MILTEPLKVLDDKIKANKAHFLDRETAKICALSSDELERYEYLTGEDLGYKPDAIQKAKFKYSPLGKVFNKGLDESDRNEGLLKRLKNIESKNEQQLEAIRDQGERQLDTIKSYSTKKESFKRLEFSSEEDQKRNKVVDTLTKMSREIDHDKLLCLHTDGTEYNFNKFGRLEPRTVLQ